MRAAIGRTSCSLPSPARRRNVRRPDGCPAIRRPHPPRRALLVAAGAVQDLLVVAIGIAAAFYLKYRNREKYESAGRLINEGL